MQLSRKLVNITKAPANEKINFVGKHQKLQKLGSWRLVHNSCNTYNVAIVLLIQTFPKFCKNDFKL